VDVRVLGPLQVWDAGVELVLGGTKTSAVLAMLVLNLNRVVSMDALVDGLWGPEPPDKATSAIHVSVSRLRKTLQGNRPAPAAGGMSEDTITKLKQLGDLHDSGVLTDEEFAAQKAKLLA